MTLTKVWRGLFLCAVLAAFGPSLKAQNFAYPLMPYASPGSARPFVWIMSSTDPASVVHGPGQTSCSVSTNICYYVPSDITTVYAVSHILNGNGGAGITVGITDAYSNSQTEADLAAFSTQTGLPACSVASGCLTFMNETGGSTLPGCSDTPSNCQTWWLEQNLDVQWVHAIAPNAHIVVVCASSPMNSDLFTALTTAAAHSNVVTNSWGEPEFAGETALDPILASSTVPLLFASGDQNFGVTLWYPSSSPYAIAVGGTHLLETATSNRNVEGAWGEGAEGGGGGGCSVYESQPSWQSGFASVCGSFRGAPDVALDADAYTGVAVYLGAEIYGFPGLYVIGGTSLASPIMAGLIANMDAARVAAGKPMLGPNLNSWLYQAAANPFYHYRFFDVTTLTNNVFSALAGWDRASGLGVPMSPADSAYFVGLP